jgi:hypothetical protein
MKTLFAVMLLSVLASADSTPFALQNGQPVSLAGSPTLVSNFIFPVDHSNADGRGLQFGDLVGAGTVVMTLSFLGKTETAICQVSHDLVLIQGFEFPGKVYQPIPATLTINGQSYSFFVVDVAPEPGTWIMLATGLVGIVARRKLRCV